MKYSFTGLEDQAVQESRGKFGSNKITPQKTESFLEKLWGNFQDPTIIILTVALGIVVVLAVFGYAEWYEGVGIAVAVIIATSVATWSEYKNENAFQKLLEDASRIQVKVFRSGRMRETSIEELVVGDFVLLQAGDKVPADGVLVAGKLQVVQASLTGEPEPVEKVSISPGGPQHAPESTTDPNWLFLSSVVSDGEAVMEVGSVGDNTFYGRLAHELSSTETRFSPLQVKLNALANNISKFGTIGAVLIALAFMFKNIFMDNAFVGQDILAYLANWPQFISDSVTAVILAVVIIVVAVPEGLPMMVAIVLSLNMRKLLADNVLVRKLLGIETAGSLNVLFSDKTGTLTKGQMEVSTFIGGDLISYEDFRTIPTGLADLLTLSLKHNTTAVIDASHGEVINIIGANRTEQVLLRFIEQVLRTQDDLEEVDIIPFDSTRKFSATQVAGQLFLTLVKGAPDLIIHQCSHYYDRDGNRVELGDITAINAKVDELAGRAMRLIAVATSQTPIGEDKKLPVPLTLVGILGLRDELRGESHVAVRQAHEAGIHVVMITGDYEKTAQAIAKDVGLLHHEDAVSLSSTELSQLSDEQLREVMPRLRVVARAWPHDKHRLVKAAKGLGWVGGMTGDGIGDSLAVKEADVGFAMGSGTEATKEAGDIVILDDNFSSLTRAVLYGRTLFRSIRKFLVFQLTVNVSAILVAFFGPFFGFDLPLTMIQLLWINLIMDTLAALAFSGEAPLSRYMEHNPISRDAPLISGDMWSSILYNGLAIAALSLVFLTYSPVKELFHSDAAFLTAFFGFFVFINNFNKFNARTDRLNLFDHILKNKGFLAVVSLIFIVQILFTYFGGEVLRTVGLTATEWLYVVMFSIVIIPLDLTRKLIRNTVVGEPDMIARTRGAAPAGVRT
jgi:Ca2+-transporting ATPase